MILSISRRTDIPAFYSEWFYKRVEEGYLITQNPMNSKQRRRIEFNDQIDCLVFWTKNPEPMIERLNEIERFNYYFHFTLNAYGTDIEPNLPSLDNRLNTYVSLAKLIGNERVIWRYDPILLNDQYDTQFHIENFTKIAKALSPYLSKCVISFIDTYPVNKKKLEQQKIHTPNADEVGKILNAFTSIAYEYDFLIETCAEQSSLEDYGICHGHCIDKKLIESVFDVTLCEKKDYHQRENCGCVQSIDIGAYSTCLNHCIYCYAQHKQNKSKFCYVDSPLMCGVE